MKIFKKENILSAVFGSLIGVLNGMLGAGGGMVAVPLLRKLGMDQKQSQANAIAVIVPITAVSAALYLFSGNVALKDAYIYIPGGIIGAVLGTFLLSKISSPILKRIFGLFVIWAGVRLLLK